MCTLVLQFTQCIFHQWRTLFSLAIFLSNLKVKEYHLNLCCRCLSKYSIFQNFTKTRRIHKSTVLLKRSRILQHHLLPYFATPPPSTETRSAILLDAQLEQNDIWRWREICHLLEMFWSDSNWNRGHCDRYKYNRYWLFCPLSANYQRWFEKRLKSSYIFPSFNQ